MRNVSKIYSGHVQAVSPLHMELYYGPQKLHLFGTKDSPLFKDHEADLMNYFYRGTGWRVMLDGVSFKIR
jgi:hypothetical protein